MAFGVVFFGLLFPWIHLFGLAAYLLLVGLEAAFVAGGLALGTVIRRQLPEPIRFLAFPMAMLAGEFARSHLPLGGFPWGGLGYSQHSNRLLLRLAAYTGVWGLSFLVATVNALLADAVASCRSNRMGAAWRAAGAVVLLLAPALLPVSVPHGAPARVALVQGNAPPRNPADPSLSDQQAVANQAAVTARLKPGQVDLVLWPESSLAQDPLTHPELFAPLAASVRALGVPFLVGANIGVPAQPGVDDGAPRFRNESLLIDASATVRSRYVKMHLVPFGEYVPGRRLLSSWVRELNRVPADGIPGTRASVFTIAQGTFASAICYETAYPELVGAFVRHGARLIVISTDNSSYQHSPTSAQMVAISQLRAAEQRVWVAQAALTGISAVIAPSGQVVQRAGLFRQALLTPTVRFATGETFYGRYGDWFPVLILVLGGLLLVAALVRPRARRPPVGREPVEPEPVGPEPVGPEPAAVRAARPQ